MLKKLLIIILLTIGVWVILNFDFFRKQVGYELQKDDSQEAPATTVEKLEPNQLLVPSLGIDAPVKYAEKVDEDHFQELLRTGVVHYPGTARPGEPGNVYIFGHSSDSPWAKGDYKTIFARLPKIEIGAKIYVSDQEGRKFVYGVKEKRVVGKDDLSVLAQDYSKKFLTLQTSHPVGTSLKRHIVVAELTE